MITVTALGTLDVRDPQRGSLTTLLAQPRRAALLVYLLVEGHGGFISRDSLLGVFWPESDEPRARAALRQALAFLRRTLGEHAIITRGDHGVGIDPTTIRCDVPAFLAAVRSANVDEALTLYGGEFLHGLIIDEAPAFDQWCAAHRDTLSRHAADAAAESADRAALDEDWATAIARARQAQVITPLSEEHHRRLLACLAGAGDRTGALEEHARFTKHLARELDVAPSAATQALVASLRQAETPGDEPARSPAVDAFPSDERASARPTAILHTATPVPPRDASLRPSRVSTRALGTAVAVVALSVTVVVALLLPVARRDSAPVVSSLSASRVVVFPLTDETRDTSLASVGRLAADWITEGIARVEGIEVVPVMALMTTTRTMSATSGTLPRTDTGAASNTDSPDAGAPDSWQRIASEVGAGVVVRGSVYRERRTLELHAQLLDAATGRVLRPVERVRTTVDSVMTGVDLLRTRVLAALAPVADTMTHLRRAIAPPTYDAYRLYVAGLETFVEGDARSALSLFLRAASADSSYPMPRIAATIMHLNLGDATSADRLLVPLRAERDRLGPLEQSTLDMTQGLLAGDLAATYDAVVRQARIAPGTIGEYMVAEIARKMNRPAEAVRVLSALGPDHGELRGWTAYWRELTAALHMLSRHDEELAAAREGARRYPNDADVSLYIVRAQAARGDWAGVQSVLADVASSRRAFPSGAALRLAALTEWLAHGRGGGFAHVTATVAWFDSLPAAVRDSARMRPYYARALLLVGRADSARRVLQPLVSRGRTPSFAVLGLAGVSAAAAGDTAESRRWTATIATRANALSVAERGLLWGEPTYWRAVIAAARADSVDALDLLRQARREGLGMEPSVHAEPAFAALRGWVPFAALLAPAVEGRDSSPRPR